MTKEEQLSLPADYITINLYKRVHGNLLFDSRTGNRDILPI